MGDGGVIFLAAARFVFALAVVGWKPLGLGVALSAALLSVVLGAWMATASICGADFPFRLNENGHCSASDWPSEVFGSICVIAGILALAGILAGRMLRSYSR